jgi:signal transduction histidine kinase/CheY-like chemotaxis protein
MNGVTPGPDSIEALRIENFELRRRLYDVEQVTASGYAHVDKRTIAEEKLRESQALLEAELADTQLLQRFSAELVHEDDIEALYGKIMATVAQVMRSDFASMQMYFAERNELLLLAFQGFSPAAAQFWKWVRADSSCTCGFALKRRERVIAPDVLHCDLMQGTDDQQAYVEAGIRAVQSTPLLTRTGKLVGMISTHWRQPHQPSERQLRLLDILARQAADLLERVQTQQALRDSEEGLRKAAESLKQADRRKDEFLATLAHELRNPLAPILNAMHILKAMPIGVPKLVRPRQIIERQVHHMVRLIDDLMDVSRITRGKLHLEKGRVSLASILEQACETSRPLIEREGHKLVVTLPPLSVELDGDAVRLAQVFSNLLNNACKYSEKGRAIRLSAAVCAHEASITVKDEGIGIAPEHLATIFDMFSQVDASGYRAQGGLGIGLSLVKAVVELHGGSVSASSEGLGKGSEFVVKLPIVSKSTSAIVCGGSMTKTATESVRVLVVDDNADSAESLALLLECGGHEVRCAFNGTDGIAMAEEFRPKLVLLDLGMPHMDGYEACRRIRALEWAKGICIVAQTGWGSDVDRQRTEKAGFDAHLVKPIKLDMLLEVMKRNA